MMRAASKASDSQRQAIRTLMVIASAELWDATQEGRFVTLLDMESLFGENEMDEARARARAGRAELAGRAKGRALVRAACAFVAAARIAHGASSFSEDVPPGLSADECILLERIIGGEV